MDYILLTLLIVIGMYLPLIIDVYENVSWKCIFKNKHDYQYIGERHGMTRAEDGNGVSGTKRRMYQCVKCGKLKPIEAEDYI